MVKYPVVIIAGYGYYYGSFGVFGAGMDLPNVNPNFAKLHFLP